MVRLRSSFETISWYVNQLNDKKRVLDDAVSHAKKEGHNVIVIPVDISKYLSDVLAGQADDELEKLSSDQILLFRKQNGDSISEDEKYYAEKAFMDLENDLVDLV